MRKNYSKIGKVLPIVAGFAALGAGAASAQDVSDPWNETWNRISLSNQLYPITLTPDSKHDLNYLLGTGNAHFVDPVLATKGIIKRLQEDRTAKEPRFSETERVIGIRRYENILKELTKREIGSYYLANIDLLNQAGKDKVLEPVKDGLFSNGEWKIYEGIFTMMSSPDCNNWSYPVYIDLKLLNGNKLEQEVQTPGLPLNPCPEDKKKNDSSSYNELPSPLIAPEVTVTEAEEETPNKDKNKTDKDYRGISLLTQATSNSEFNAYSTSLGVRFNPFKNTDIGFGASLKVGFGLDSTGSYTTPLLAGRTAYGEITDTNKRSIGGSLELQLGPFIFGGGANYSTWITKTLAQILDSSGDVIASNSDSTPNRQVFADVSGGVEIPIGDKFKLRVLGGYDGRNGGYFGAGGTIKLK